MSAEAPYPGHDKVDPTLIWNGEVWVPRRKVLIKSNKSINANEIDGLFFDETVDLPGNEAAQEDEAATLEDVGTL